MNFLKHACCLALLGAGLVTVPSALAQGSAAPTAADETSLVQELRQEADGVVAVSRSRATGAVGSVRASGAAADLLPGVAADGRTGAGAKADAYLERYAAAFGAARGELTRTGISASRSGWTVRYEQSYRGVPVFGSRLLARVDAQGDLTGVNGFVAPDVALGTTPRLSRQDATAKALALVTEKPSGQAPLSAAEAEGLRAASAELMVYRMGAIQGVTGRTVLAWVIEATNQKQVRETVVLDAVSGKPVNRYSMIDHALDRTLIEAYDGEQDPEVVWEEGDAFPGDLDADQQSEVLTTAESYWMYRNTFGYKSYDGQDAPMITVNNDPGIQCPNASWNGISTNYCDGVSSDDTVAHEWGHAYTEYTSGLLYQWQPGAMNEAWSDIWGETVDILNTRFNETPDTPRTTGKCSAFTHSDVELLINAPAPIAGSCEAAPSTFGPVLDTTGVTDDVVVAAPLDGCAALTNAAAVAGKFVYVDRGVCTADVKADNAEAAGATGIIIGNNAAGPPSSPVGSASIPGLMITQDKGAAIKAATGVDATMRSISNDPVDNSYRWLSGEGDPAFGGAIRDMWNPTCYGDPGKVSDVEYFCSTDDSGGVHSNSGVVNHGYALLVDGGDYNGETVPAIGLDKAANLYWDVQTNYLTPTSGFPELADALEGSCADLTGRPIDAITLGGSVNAADGAGANGAATPEAADPITEDDCAAVATMIAATELRTPPTQCNFTTLLKQGAPAEGCGNGLKTTTVYTEDFEDGLAGWTQDAEVPLGSVAGGIAWEATAALPESTKGGGTHTSRVAYAPMPDEGSCAPPDDISSRNGLISPSITVPSGTAPRMSFDHYVATEADYDGVNVKYRVGSGAWTLVPATAYLFNAPGAALETEAGGNTNPMAGQVGFTGTDGGSVFGSWGRSYVDLSALAPAGTALQFRFDAGRDGCGGVDGWYVDNVSVTVCSSGTTPPPPPGVVTSKSKAKAPRSVEQGDTFIAKVKVKAVDGTVPAGKVRIKAGGKVVGKGKVKNGKARIKVRTSALEPGKTRFKVVYLGSGNIAKSKDTFFVVLTTS